MKSRTESIKQEIIHRMDLKEFAGNRLPSEVEMAQSFQISRMTYRRIVSELVEEGRVVVIHGLGTFIATPLPVIPGSMEKLESLGTMITNCGFTEGESINRIEEGPADSGMAGILGINRGDSMIQIERTRFADSSPIAFSVNYLPRKTAGNIFAKEAFSGSLFHFLERYGAIKIACADTEFSLPESESPQAKKAYQHLNTDKGIFLLKQLHYDQFNNPVLYSFDYLREDVFKFHLRRRR